MATLALRGGSSALPDAWATAPPSASAGPGESRSNRPAPAPPTAKARAISARTTFPFKPGITFGETDDYCYNITKDPVHIHDLNATVLASLGIDHKRLTYRFQGRDFRLTDVHGEVVNNLFA